MVHTYAYRRLYHLCSDIVRANANTPLNENAPDNIFALKSYLNREQYESAPLLYAKT